MNLINKSRLLYLLLFFFFQSCYKDDSQPAGTLTAPLLVTDVAESYTVQSQGGRLHIEPTIQGTDQADHIFTWLLYDATFISNNPKLPVADTLGRTQNLDYTFNHQKTGEYVLVLKALNAKNNIAQLFKYKVTITTPYLSGWYVLKENAGSSDLDFHYAGGKIENWIAQNNNGQSLMGKAKKAFWVPRMKNSLQSTDLFSGLAVLTDQDVALFKLEDGTKLHDYSSIFFSQPAEKRLQNLLLAMNGNLILVNNGRYYIMNQGAKFGSTRLSNYEIGDIGVSASMDILFDTSTKTVFLNDGVNIRTLLSNGAALKNMGTDLYWAEAYRGTRSSTTLLFKNPVTGEGKFFKLNTTIGPFIDANQILIAQQTDLPSGHHLLAADVINGNYDNDLLYYSKDNQLYYSAFLDLTPVLQKTFDAGETISCIQHIKYPAPNSGVVNSFNKVAVATYKDNNYQIWIADINSTGTLSFKAEPDFKGKGKVKSFTYFENGNGNFLYR